jgi:uncharacterized phiE125 gp8 family phage protein
LGENALAIGDPIPGVDRPVSFTMSADSPQIRVEPISLETARLACKNPPSSENDLLQLYIEAAREYFEEQTRRQLVNAVWEYALDQFPAGGVIELPRAPLVDDVTVFYDDSGGVETELEASAYTVKSSRLSESSPPEERIDPYCPPGSIVVAQNTLWPSSSGLSRSVRIRRTCGYGTTEAEMPGSARWVLLLLVSHMYRYRSALMSDDLKVLPLGAEAVINNFKYTAKMVTVARL